MITPEPTLECAVARYNQRTETTSAVDVGTTLVWTVFLTRCSPSLNILLFKLTFVSYSGATDDTPNPHPP